MQAAFDLYSRSFQLPASSYAPLAPALVDRCRPIIRMFRVKNEKAGSWKLGAGSWKLDAVSVIAFLSSGCADADHRATGPTFFAPA